jgi:hypothetical protein
MKQLLFDPFIRLAGGHSLLAGLFTLLLTGLIGYYGPAHFDGVLDTHQGMPMSLWFFLAEQLINWLSLTLCLYIAGLICAQSRPRLIDIAGTQAFARWPMIFTALVFLLPIPMPDIHHLDDISPLFWLSTLVDILILIWVIALMYRAYVTAAHVKGTKAVISFIIALLLAEVISKFIIVKMMYATIESTFKK